MFFAVEIQQDRCHSCNYKLHCKEQQGFKVRKKIRLIFCRPKDSMNGKCYVFSDYKQTNDVRFLYLEC